MFLILLFLFWVPIGAGIGAAIGSSKGQAGAGAALGAVLGIIGWIIVACMAPSPQVQYERDQRFAMTMRSIMTNTGWHPDPSGRHEHRYWDGARWTEHVTDRGVASIDP